MCQIDLRLPHLVWWNIFMPDASHMPSICGRTHSSLRLRSRVARFGLERGLGCWDGEGSKQPDAIISFLFFGSAWAVCAVARWINSLSAHCLACDPLPARRGHLSRTLANRPPLAERSSYPRRGPAFCADCRANAVGDAESESDDEEGCSMALQPP